MPRHRNGTSVTYPFSGFTTMARGLSCSPFSTTPIDLPSNLVTVMTLVASQVQQMQRLQISMLRSQGCISRFRTELTTTVKPQGKKKTHTHRKLDSKPDSPEITHNAYIYVATHLRRKSQGTFLAGTFFMSTVLLCYHAFQTLRLVIKTWGRRAS